jgi:hypothetical protein
MRKAMRKLWRTDIKHWCESKDRSIDWGRGEKEEQELAEWFSMVDVDQGGSLEEDEIRALMDAMGVTINHSDLVKLFGSVGKSVNGSLSKNDFVRLMTGDEMTDLMAGSTFASSSGGLFDVNTRLMMLAYRRQRLLKDISVPSKRRNFQTIQSFNEAYGQTLSDQPTPRRSERPATPPHPMTRLDSYRLRPPAKVRVDARAPPSPQPVSYTPRRAGRSRRAEGTAAAAAAASDGAAADGRGDGSGGELPGLA